MEHLSARVYLEQNRLILLDRPLDTKHLDSL